MITGKSSPLFSIQESFSKGVIFDLQSSNLHKKRKSNPKQHHNAAVWHVYIKVSERKATLPLHFDMLLLQWTVSLWRRCWRPDDDENQHTQCAAAVHTYGESSTWSKDNQIYECFPLVMMPVYIHSYLTFYICFYLLLSLLIPLHICLNLVIHVFLIYIIRTCFNMSVYFCSYRFLPVVTLKYLYWGTVNGFNGVI